MFFMGLGSLVEKAGAEFKSDEKALQIIARAREALGGESALSAVKSMKITGTTNRTIDVNGEQKTFNGETSIAIQFPDKMQKNVLIKDNDNDTTGVAGENIRMIMVGKVRTEQPQANAVITTDLPEKTTGRIVTVNKNGGEKTYTGAEADVFFQENADKTVTFRSETDQDPKKINIVKGSAIAAPRHNEILRTALSLLLTPPQGIDVSFTSAGTSDVDGTLCDVVQASAGASNYKLFISRTTSLPIAVSFSGMPSATVMQFRRIDDLQTPSETPSGDKKVVLVRKMVSENELSQSEVMIKFSDYRTVNGIQLPFVWSESVNGRSGETLNVTSYEVNPPNIADSFAPKDGTLVRVRKTDEK